MTAEDGYTTSDWIIDSGASKHMCNNKSLFSSIRKSQVNHITIANRETLPVEGEGEIYIAIGSKKVKLLNVLYVPKVAANLLSVGCIINANCNIVFHKSDCKILNIEGIVVLTGCLLKNGVYKLNLSTKVDRNVQNPSNVVTAFSSKAHESMSTWHRRMAT